MPGPLHMLVSIRQEVMWRMERLLIWEKVKSIHDDDAIGTTVCHFSAISNPSSSSDWQFDFLRVATFHVKILEDWASSFFALEESSVPGSRVGEPYKTSWVVRKVEKTMLSSSQIWLPPVTVDSSARHSVSIEHSLFEESGLCWRRGIHANEMCIRHNSGFFSPGQRVWSSQQSTETGVRMLGLESETCLGIH